MDDQALGATKVTKEEKKMERKTESRQTLLPSEGVAGKFEVYGRQLSVGSPSQAMTAVILTYVSVSSGAVSSNLMMNMSIINGELVAR